MRAYYNEIDPKAAAWLRELIKEGVITDGEVDERSIEDVLPADLAGFDRCHFFAGIGVWDYALNLSEFTGKVWTGSCPCQPFSTAGKREGFDDERHLWPAWFHLIEVCRPDTIFGEQVASKDGLTWLDLVSADVEGIGYSIGAVDLPVAGVGAPHRRQRFFFGVGLADSNSSEPRGLYRGTNGAGQEVRFRDGIDLADGREPDRLEITTALGRGRRGDGDTSGSGRQIQAQGRSTSTGVAQGDTGDTGLQGRTTRRLLSGGRTTDGHGGQAGGANTGVGLADTQRTEHARDDAKEGRALGCGESGGMANPSSVRLGKRPHEAAKERWQPRSKQRWQFPSRPEGRSFTNGFWGDVEWVYCNDPDGARWRPIKPGTFPLADRTPGRVALLRGAGNAISPWAAKAFIESWTEAVAGT